MTLSNTHDLIIGGDGIDENNTINGFIDDLRINTDKARYNTDFIPSSTPNDDGLNDTENRRQQLINNIIYSPQEQNRTIDVELAATEYDEQTTGKINAIGYYSDGSTFDANPYTTFTQKTGQSWANISTNGNITTSIVTMEDKSAEVSLNLKHKGILSKTFTIIVRDSIISHLLLDTALQYSGVNPVVCIDASHPNWGIGSTIFNLAMNFGISTGQFYPTSDFSRVIGPGVLNSYFNIGSSTALAPRSGTLINQWAYDLNKQGTSYSFCAMVKNYTNYTLCSNWNGSTSGSGFRIRWGKSGDLMAEHWRRSVSPTGQTSLTVNARSPMVGITYEPLWSQWMFVAGSVTDGGRIFFRRYKEYLNIKSYKQSTITTTVDSSTQYLNGIGLLNPTVLNSGYSPFSISNTPSESQYDSQARLGYFAFMLGETSEEQFDAIYDYTKDRFGL